MKNRRIELYYGEGSSDKVYNVELVENISGEWRVNFEYGRRGTSLNTGSKCEGCNYIEAKKVFDKLVKSKTAKGYEVTSETEDDSSVFVGGIPDPKDEKEYIGVIPQLLNEIDEKDELWDFINNPNFCMQEKHDGKRRILIRDEHGVVQGGNRKGEIVSISASVVLGGECMKAPYILDGEDMGDKLMLFDDITEPNLPYEERYQILKKLAEDTPNVIQVVETAFTTEEKTAMYNRLKEERAEGVVFKNLMAPYSAGRPSKGGDQFKCKFWDSASCVVTSVGEKGKSSISLAVINNMGMSIPVGNATLYANSPEVKKGDIVEIKYLYYNEGGSLYQPVLLDVRDDLDYKDCLESKLKRKKSDVKPGKPEKV